MTLRELLKEGTDILSSANVENAGHDAAELLKHVYGMDTAELLLKIDRQICPGALGYSEPADITCCPGDCGGVYSFRDLINKRALRVPLQHLLGYVWFMGFEFFVNKDVLIPRQDTEVLAQVVLEYERDPGISLLDLGTGSGALAVSLKKLGGYRSVAASDISGSALAKARENALHNSADIKFYKSDLFDDTEGPYDVIVSNPPYIPHDVIALLEPEVRDYDPLEALDGGADGLGFYRRIACDCRRDSVLSAGGRVYLETGYDQAAECTRILESAGFRDIRIIKDLAGLDRVVIGRKPCSE